jgi:hypothetical protein
VSPEEPTHFSCEVTWAFGTDYGLVLWGEVIIIIINALFLQLDLQRPGDWTPSAGMPFLADRRHSDPPGFRTPSIRRKSEQSAERETENQVVFYSH